MLNSTVGTDPITETLIKKAEKTGMPFSTLKEVFERGLSLYVEQTNQTPEQVAFNRVNSYISKGRAWNLDADLREEKIVNEQLDTAFNDLLEKQGLWANIHAKRQRIKAGSGERMRKPGEKGAPTPAGLKSAQEAAREIVDRRPVTLKSKRRQQEVQKKIIDEGETKPYVKPHIEKGSTKQSAWVASNKWGKKKYFGMDFKSSAHKHAGVSEDTSAQREIGTNSLAKKYKKDTPGQEKADLNETFNMAWTAGIGVTLSAEECGIKMKPAFELHPDVVDAMEEVRSADIKGVVVRTADGKTIIRKQKRNRKIIGSGNLTDGKPDDTL
jgi:phage terminase large subunit-like protein